MRRNIGNELIVALFAAMALVFAALFAIFLASSTQNPPRPTPSAEGTQPVTRTVRASPPAGTAAPFVATAQPTELVIPPSPMPAATEPSIATFTVTASATAVAQVDATLARATAQVEPAAATSTSDADRRALTQIAQTAHPLVLSLTAISRDTARPRATASPSPTRIPPTATASAETATGAATVAIEATDGGLRLTATALAETIETLKLSLTPLQPSATAPAPDATATPRDPQPTRLAADIGATLTQLAQTARGRSLELTAAALTRAAMLTTSELGTTQLAPTATALPARKTATAEGATLTSAPDRIRLTLTPPARTSEAVGLTLTADREAAVVLPTSTAIATQMELATAASATTAATPPSIGETYTPTLAAIRMTLTQLAQTAAALDVTLTVDGADRRELTATLARTAPAAAAIGATLTQLAETADAHGLALTAAAEDVAGISLEPTLVATETSAGAPTQRETEPPGAGIRATLTQLAATADSHELALTAAAEDVAVTPPESTPRATDRLTEARPQRETETVVDGISATLTQLAATGDARALALTAEAENVAAIPPEHTPRATDRSTEAPSQRETKTPVDGISATETQLAATADSYELALTAAAEDVAVTPPESTPSATDRSTEAPQQLETETPVDGISATETQLAATSDARGVSLTEAAKDVAAIPPERTPRATDRLTEARPQRETETPVDGISATLTQLAATGDARGLALTAGAEDVDGTPPERTPSATEATTEARPQRETETPGAGISATLTQLAATADAHELALTAAAEDVAVTPPESRPRATEATTEAPPQRETDTVVDGISATLTQLAATGDARALALTAAAEDVAAIPPERTPRATDRLADPRPQRETEIPVDGISATLTQLAATADSHELALTAAAEDVAVTPPESTPSATDRSTEARPQRETETPVDGTSATLTQMAATGDASALAFTAAAEDVAAIPPEATPRATHRLAEARPQRETETPGAGISATLTQLAATGDARGLALTAEAEDVAGTPQEPTPRATEATTEARPQRETETVVDGISATLTQLAATGDASALALTAEAEDVDGTPTEPTPSALVTSAEVPLGETETVVDGISATLTQLAATGDASALALTAVAEDVDGTPREPTPSATDRSTEAPSERETETVLDGISATLTQLAATSDARGLALTAEAEDVAGTPPERTPRATDRSTEAPSERETETVVDGISATETQFAATGDARGLALTAATENVDGTPLEPTPSATDRSTEAPSERETVTPVDGTSETGTQIAATGDASALALTAKADEADAIPPERTPRATVTSADVPQQLETETVLDGISATLTQMAATGDARGLALTAEAEDVAGTPPEHTPSATDRSTEAPSERETETVVDGKSATETQLAATSDARALALTAAAEDVAVTPPEPTPRATDRSAEAPLRETEMPVDGISATLTQLAATADSHELALTAAADDVAGTPQEPTPRATEATTEARPQRETGKPVDGIGATLTQLAATGDARGLALTAEAEDVAGTPPERTPRATDRSTEAPSERETETVVDGISATLTQLAATGDARGLALTAAAVDEDGTPPEATPSATEATTEARPQRETEMPVDGISATLTQLAATGDARGLALTAAAVDEDGTPPEPTPSATEATTEARIQRETETPVDGISAAETQLAATGDARGLALTAEAEEVAGTPQEATPSATEATTEARPQRETETPVDGISAEETQLAATADSQELALTAAAEDVAAIPPERTPNAIDRSTEAPSERETETVVDGISATLTQLAATGDARALALTAEAEDVAGTPPEPTPSATDRLAEARPQRETETPVDGISATLTQLAATADSHELAVTAEAEDVAGTPPEPTPRATDRLAEARPQRDTETVVDGIGATLTQLAATTDARGLALTAAVEDVDGTPPEPTPRATDRLAEARPQRDTETVVDGIGATLTQLAATTDARGLALTAAVEDVDGTPPEQTPRATDRLAEARPQRETETPVDGTSATGTRLAATGDARGLALTAGAEDVAGTPPEHTPSATDRSTEAPQQLETETVVAGISATLTQLAATSDARGLASTAEAEDVAAIPPESTPRASDRSTEARPQRETEPPDDGISAAETQMTATGDERGLALTAQPDDIATISPERTPTATVTSADVPQQLETEMPVDGISATLTQLAATADSHELALTAVAEDVAGTPPERTPGATDRSTEARPQRETETVVDGKSATETSAGAPTQRATETVVDGSMAQTQLAATVLQATALGAGGMIDQTPLPAVRARLIATPTPFGTVDLHIREDCEPRDNWMAYTVKEGETLLAIALAAGSDLAEMRQGNCYQPVKGVFAGETLLAPRLPRKPVATAVPVFPPAGALLPAEGCDGGAAQIDSPLATQGVSGIVAVMGSAVFPPGGGYRLDVRPAWSEAYLPYLSESASVRRDTLGVINTEVFGSGLHHVRLSVFGADGALIANGTCAIPLLFTAEGADAKG